MSVRVSLHEAIGGEEGARQGIYHPERLAEGVSDRMYLPEGAVVKDALFTAEKVPFGEFFVVPHSGWYVIVMEANPENA